MKFEIKHKFLGKILFELECASLKVCLEKAVYLYTDLHGADLRNSDLRGAYLNGADLRGAYLNGAYLNGAHLSGADLSDSDLSGAYLNNTDLRNSGLRNSDLSGADLHGADLHGADLSGAYLSSENGEKIKIKKIPLQIIGLRWDIIVFDSHMKIGCEFHLIKNWVHYDDDRISNMDSYALEWWKEHKQMIISFCNADGRQ
jgi:hypothetical protein